MFGQASTSFLSLGQGSSRSEQGSSCAGQRGLRRYKHLEMFVRKAESKEALD